MIHGRSCPYKTWAGDVVMSRRLEYLDARTRAAAGRALARLKADGVLWYKQGA